MTRKEDVPDSTRSWAVALSACGINVLMSGITRTTGLLYVAIMDTNGVSRFQANMPFAVRNIVRNLAGPLVGALGQRFGPRDVTLMGGVFASLGVLLCSFTSSILWITLLWGGMHGLGVALGNTLCQVVVTQYFVKHRATATGLAFSGACFGSFFLPILMEYMLDHVGLYGTFLITGGLLMHVLPAALILKEPSWIKKKTKAVPGPDVPPSKTLTFAKEFTKLSLSGKDSTHVLATHFKQQRHSFGDSDPKQDEMRNSCVRDSSTRNDGVDNPAFLGSVTSVKDVSLNQANENHETEKLNNYLRAEDTKDPPHLQQQQQETSLCRGILMIWRDPLFHMISLSLGAFAMLIDPVFTVIVDYFMDKGFEEEVAKYFISAMAFGDLVGRLGFGWVTDRNFVSVPNFMMITQVANGVLFLLIPSFYGFYSLMVMTILFGMIAGASLVMYPILVSKYLQSVQSLAYGSMSFFTGLLTSTVPFLVGYFRDEVGSYNGMFYITGGSSVIVGFLWIFEPLLLKLRTKFEKGHNATAGVAS